jgi:acyl dehydratase
MAIDKSIIGKTGTPFTMPIEWSKVREFARAIRDPNPIYFNPELAKKECGGIPVPPTFLQVASFWMGEDSMPTAKFDMRRILHGEQDFEFVKPIFVGDVLTGTSRIADVYEKEGGDRNRIQKSEGRDRRLRARHAGRDRKSRQRLSDGMERGFGQREH